MWETAVKKHEEKIYQRGVLFEKQQILIDLMKIKFGVAISDEKKILAQTDTEKLGKALHKFVTAKTREEVLKCLD